MSSEKEARSGSSSKLQECGHRHFYQVLRPSAAGGAGPPNCTLLRTSLVQSLASSRPSTNTSGILNSHQVSLDKLRYAEVKRQGPTPQNAPRTEARLTLIS